MAHQFKQYGYLDEGGKLVDVGSTTIYQDLFAKYKLKSLSKKSRSGKTLVVKPSYVERYELSKDQLPPHF